MAAHCQLPALYSPSPPEPAIPSEPGGLLTSEQTPADNPGASESGSRPPPPLPPELTVRFYVPDAVSRPRHPKTEVRVAHF